MAWKESTLLRLLQHQLRLGQVSPRHQAHWCLPHMWGVGPMEGLGLVLLCCRVLPASPRYPRLSISFSTSHCPSLHGRQRPQQEQEQEQGHLLSEATAVPA